jgi:tungstate transport system substrate-binding protein
MSRIKVNKDLKGAKVRNLSKKQKKAIGISAIVILTGILGIFMAIEIIRAQNRIILATTTSTYDSGLLDYLLPTFEERSGISVEILAVGTGQALETAQRGDADLLLVHSRIKEDQFLADGNGIHRACIMYNDFIIIGPTSDPANIQGENVSITMTKLKSAGELGTIKFYSRGDNSGTYSKELNLWANISFTPDSGTDSWYFETGAGMGDTLSISNQNNGYTLIDRGTWLYLKSNVDLISLVEGEEILLNPYGAILVNPELHPAVKYELALKFIAFLTSKEGQDLIGAYKINNEILFNPAFGRGNETHNCPTTAEEIAFWKQHNGGYEGV